VLSHATWKRLFGGSESALGRSIELNQKPYRIIGVMDRNPLAGASGYLGAARPAAGRLQEQNRFNESYFTAVRMRRRIVDSSTRSSSARRPREK